MQTFLSRDIMGNHGKSINQWCHPMMFVAPSHLRVLSHSFEADEIRYPSAYDPNGTAPGDPGHPDGWVKFKCRICWWQREGMDG